MSGVARRPEPADNTGTRFPGAAMTPTPTRTGLPADLVERVNALTPEQRDELFELTALDNLPPDTRTEEELMADLVRDAELADSGAAASLTREEAKEQVRAFLREKYGYEL